MEKIKLKQLDQAFEENSVRNITIIRLSDQKWYFTFEADDPITEEPQVYSLKTQRGKLRVWSDPRKLICFLYERYGVSGGSFFVVNRDE